MVRQRLLLQLQEVHIPIIAPYNQNSITSNRSSPVPKNSVNSRIIPQTMNPPIDMKSNNILNPEKDTDTSRGDHLESKASSISSASGTTTTNNNNVSNNNSTGKLKLFYSQII